MNDLFKQLKVIGFSDEYIKIIEDQKFGEVLPTETSVTEYVIYNSPVEYLTKSSLQHFSHKEEKSCL